MKQAILDDLNALVADPTSSLYDVYDDVGDGLDFSHDLAQDLLRDYINVDDCTAEEREKLERELVAFVSEFYDRHRRIRILVEKVGLKEVLNGISAYTAIVANNARLSDDSDSLDERADMLDAFAIELRAIADRL